MKTDLILFCKLLKQKGVYEIFYYNFYNYISFSQSWEKTRHDVFFGDIKNIFPSTFLTYAFDWANTIQGADFWIKICKELETYGEIQSSSALYYYH